MADRPAHHRDRLPGWPPGRADHRGFWRIPSDDLVLAILWALVILGLLGLSALAIFGLLGVAGRTVEVAYAAEEEAGPTAPVSGVLSDPVAIWPPLASDAREVDVSAAAGVTAGRLLDSTVHSNTLGMELPYRIYLPPGYYSTDDRYPVLYLLHGIGADYTEWTNKNHIGAIADALIAGGAIRPMLIVMPEGDHSYFMNHAGNGPRWADYVAQDLVSFIDANYRALPDANNRAIGGLSMGGEAALQLAFNHPGVFSIVGAHSPALHESIEGAPNFFGNQAYYSSYDPLELATTSRNLRSLKIWVDVGEEDQFREPGERLHRILTFRGILHQWRLYPGAHDNGYWTAHASDYLRFYSGAFKEQNAPWIPPTFLTAAR